MAVRHQPKTSNRPGATKCSACNVVTDYKTMVKVGRKWYCTSASQEDQSKDGCVERIKRYGLWPPN